MSEIVARGFGDGGTGQSEGGRVLDFTAVTYRMELERCLSGLIDCLGMCERILTTPVPRGYRCVVSPGRVMNLAVYVVCVYLCLWRLCSKVLRKAIREIRRMRYTPGVTLSSSFHEGGPPQTWLSPPKPWLNMICFCRNHNAGPARSPNPNPRWITTPSPTQDGSRHHGQGGFINSVRGKIVRWQRPENRREGTHGRAGTHTEHAGEALGTVSPVKIRI